MEIAHLLHNFEAKTVVLPRFFTEFQSQSCGISTFFTFSTLFEAKTVICLHFLHTCEATNWYYHTFCTVWNLKLWYDHMFCIVFEPKLWYYHQFFIVWKSNLWCFCILCVVLEAKLWNYHMFWHVSSIFHRVEQQFYHEYVVFPSVLTHFWSQFTDPPFGKLDICCGKLAFG